MSNLLSTDPGRALLERLVKVCLQKLDMAMEPPRIQEPDEEGVLKWVTNPAYVAMPAGELSAIRQLLSDNSVTLSNIRRGDFGETVQRAAEDFPFPQSPGLQ